jgi:TetR/AcrR family transcriptional regulator, transcriptional repressor for nem operon
MKLVTRGAMARPREFDVEHALDGALQLFWAKGYEATSLDEICDATGLSRSSLYGTFGDKRALLLRSLERYSEGGSARIAARLEATRPIRAALQALLDDFIAQIVAGPGRRGCFIGNCAAELARGDREAMACVRRSLERNTTVFRDALARAQARGELAAGADIAEMARFLTAGIQGLRLVGKAMPDRVTLDGIASSLLRCLDADRTNVAKQAKS